MGHSALQGEEEEEDDQKVTSKLRIRTDRASSNNTHTGSVHLLLMVRVALCTVAERALWTKALHKASICVPGFGPSIPQELENCHLFGGEVSPHEVNSVFGKVRGDY